MVMHSVQRSSMYLIQFQERKKNIEVSFTSLYASHDETRRL